MAAPSRSHVLVPSSGTVKLATSEYTDGANVKDDEVGVLGEQHLPTYVTYVTGASTATLNSHLIQIMAGASLNVYLRRLIVWQQAMATAAAVAGFGLYRLTTAGTGGGVMPTNPPDFSDPGSGATAMSLPTVKGTEAATALWVARAYLMQTIAASSQLNEPTLDLNFDAMLRSKEPKINVGTANGFALKLLTAVAGGTVDILAVFSEAAY